jgi:hypothetical protein
VGETPVVSRPTRPGLSVEQTPAQGEVRFQLSGAGASELAVYDAAGNLVRTLAATGRAAVWNGTDATGRPVPSGMYLAQLRRPGSTHTVRFAYLNR